MKILAISDIESPYFWDYYEKKKLADIDLILSAGDLRSEYLSFLVTMSSAPVLYVHGNHDTEYKRKPWTTSSTFTRASGFWVLAAP